MDKRIADLLAAFQLCVFLFVLETDGFMQSKLPSEQPIKYVILDTDMGGDDAWALQMLLKAEKELRNVKLLAITTVVGNADMTDVIKNTYRILDGLNRTDVRCVKFIRFLHL